MDDIKEFNYNLPPQEHYEKALYYKDKDINKYFMYLTQSANFNYEDAIFLLHWEYYNNNDKKQRPNISWCNFYKTTGAEFIDYS